MKLPTSMKILSKYLNAFILALSVRPMGLLEAVKRIRMEHRMRKLNRCGCGWGENVLKTELKSAPALGSYCEQGRFAGGAPSIIDRPRGGPGSKVCAAAQFGPSRRAPKRANSSTVNG